jgi:hypothetical protein
MSPNNTYAYTEAVTQIVYVRQTLNLESAEWQNEFHFQQLAMWWLTQMQMQSVPAMRRLAVAVHEAADLVESGDPNAVAPPSPRRASNDAAPTEPVPPTPSWDRELTSDDEQWGGMSSCKRWNWRLQLTSADNPPCELRAT